MCFTVCELAVRMNYVDIYIQDVSQIYKLRVENHLVCLRKTLCSWFISPLPLGCRLLKDERQVGKSTTAVLLRNWFASFPLKTIGLHSRMKLWIFHVRPLEEHNGFRWKPGKLVVYWVYRSKTAEKVTNVTDISM